MKSVLADGVAVVRAMPNTPALIGEGMFGISPGTSVSDKQMARVVSMSKPAARSSWSMRASRTRSPVSLARAPPTSSTSPRR